MSLVSVVGSKQKYDIGDPNIRSSLVKIANQYYWRDSDEIVKVDGRFYRKESPLIVKDYAGNFIPKISAIKLAPGVYASKSDQNVVELHDGSFASKNHAAEVKGKWYLLTDPRIVEDFIAQIKLGTKSFILKEQAIPLWERAYGKNIFVSKSYKGSLTMLDDGFILTSDATHYIDADGVLKTTHKTLFQSFGTKERYVRVFWKFKNPNFPSPEHIKTLWAHPSNKMEILPNSPIPNPVLQKDIPKIKKAIEFYNNLSKRDSCDAIRERLNKFYDEAGPDENNAKDFTLNYDTIRGGGVQVNGGGKLSLSPTCKLTGNKKYTIGVEVETSAGLLTDSDLKKIGWSLVGDSSIGSGEYTSPPLHGDIGIKNLEQAMKLFASKTLVDNRCSVHIHIGGAKDDGSETVWMPSFGPEFAISAANLGAQLEDELFSSMPPYRQPDIRYCSSIKRFAPVTSENWRNVLGAWVFGPEVDQLDDGDVANGVYAIGKKYNSNQELNRWCSGRYKWLNLVNVLSKGRFKTIEFRIFGATTCFEKVYNYVLTCLAFVWFVENRPGLIEKGKVTLNKMFEEAYEHQPKLAHQLQEFYAERKARFAKARAKVDKV